MNATKEMLDKVMEQLKKETLSSVIHITVHPGEDNLTESKFGGTPYLPREEAVPTDEDGEQLTLLAQINAAELPENDFMIKEGLLQFWIFADADLGMGADDAAVVKYYKAIDSSVTKEEVLEKYHPYMEDDEYFPVEGVYQLSYKVKQEGMSMNDYQFDGKFNQIWDSLYPGVELTEELEDELYENYSGEGHKLGGYPEFAQSDPREYGEYEGYQLLFQMSSQEDDDVEIMWGDAGVCGFFITKEDLQNRCFDRVLYNWDCG